MAWSLVAGGKIDPSGVTAASKQVTLSGAVAVNDLIVVSVTRGYTASTADLPNDTCTDQLGNTYTKIGAGSDNVDGQAWEWWYSVVSVAGTPTITVTTPVSHTYFGVLAQAFRTSTGTPALDLASTAAANAATSTTGANNGSSSAITTTAAGDLIVAMFMDTSSAGLVTAGTTPVAYTAGQAFAASGGNGILEYATQVSAGSISATAGLAGGSGVQYGSGIAAFKASGSAQPPANISAPAVTGTTKQGNTLSVSNGSWNNSPTSYTYQWQRDDTNGVFTNIAGATANTYVLAAGDLRLQVRCVVTATNAAGSTPANSNSVGPITADPVTADSPAVGPIVSNVDPPSNQVPPSIVGAADIGFTLTGNDGSWSGATSFTRKWQTDLSGSWVDIPGATSNVYVIKPGDLGAHLRYVVTGTNAQGSVTANSATVGPVADPTTTPTPGQIIEQDFGTSFADAVIAEMTPVMSSDLETFIRALSVMFQEVDWLGRDHDDIPAWNRIVDLNGLPDNALPWLGQFVGVTVDTSQDISTQRAQISGVSGWARGSAVAMRNLIAPLLTGNKQVIFAERDGDPYTLTVITRTSETPDPNAVLTALMAQKPAGIILNYVVSDGRTYLEVRTSYASYTALRSAFATYSALRGY